MHSTFIYLSALILLANFYLFTCNLSEVPLPVSSVIHLKHVVSRKCVELNARSNIVLRKCSGKDDQVWNKLKDTETNHFNLLNKQHEKALSNAFCKERNINFATGLPFKSQKGQYWTIINFGHETHILLENQLTGKCLTKNNLHLEEVNCDPEDRRQYFTFEYLKRPEKIGKENFSSVVIPIRYRPAFFTLRPNPVKIQFRAKKNVDLQGHLKDQQGKNVLTDDEAKELEITLVNLKTNKRYKANIQNSHYVVRVPSGQYRLIVQSKNFKHPEETLNLRDRQNVKDCLLEKIAQINNKSSETAYLVGNSFPGQLILSEDGHVNLFKQLKQ